MALDVLNSFINNGQSRYYWAPITAAALDLSDISTPIPATYHDTGIQASEGIEETFDQTVNVIKGLQGKIEIRSSVSDDSFKVTLRMTEVKKENMELYYASTVDENGVMEILTGKEAPYIRIAYDLVDGDNGRVQRTFFHRAKITNRSNVTYDNENLATFELEITASVDPTTNKQVTKAFGWLAAA